MTYFQNKTFYFLFFYYLEFLNSDGDTNCYTWFSLGTDVCFHTYEARFITPVPWIVFKAFNPTTSFCFFYPLFDGTVEKRKAQTGERYSALALRHMVIWLPFATL